MWRRFCLGPMGLLIAFTIYTFHRPIWCDWAVSLSCGCLLITLDDCCFDWHCRSAYCIQVARLSQRDRAAGWVSCDPKAEDCNWETIFYRQWSTFNHCDVTGTQSNRIRWKKTQNKSLNVVQGHSRSSRLVSIESPHATSYSFVTEIISHTVSELSQLTFRILDTLRFWAPLWGLRTHVDYIKKCIHVYNINAFASMTVNIFLVWRHGCVALVNVV